MEKNILIVLYSVILGLFIIIGSFFILLNNFHFYDTEFNNLGVYDSFNQTFVKSAGLNMIQYLNGENLINIYTQDEVKHLEDVEEIIFYFRILFYLLAILSFTLFYFNIKIVWKSFIGAFFFVFILSSFLFLLSFFNFDFLFNNFHYFFFFDGSWIFGDASTLVNLFPEQFFFDALLRIVGYSFLLSLIFLFIGLYFRENNLNLK